MTHVTTVHSAMDARILYREAVGLANLGYEVTVVGRHSRDAKVGDVAVQGLSMPARRLLRWPMSVLEGTRILFGPKSDVFHFHDPELLPVAVLGQLLGRHCVYDAHEDVTLILVKDWVPSWSRRPLAWVVGRIDQFAGKRLDAIVTVTEPLRARYSGFARRVSLFVNYPPPDFFHWVDVAWTPWDDRRNEIIHVGSLRMERLRFLVSVLSAFLRDHADWQASLIGLSAEQLLWLEATRAEPLRDRLVGMGKQPYRTVGELMCKARIGINYHPLDAPHIQVAIPVKVFEYLTCGLPTLTTKVPQLLAQVKGCPSVLVGDESEERYLAALSELANRSDLKALCESARRFSREKFSCEMEAKRLSDLYEEILAGEAEQARENRESGA